MLVFFSVELGNLWPQSAFIYYISIISMETCTVAIYWVASSLDHKMYTMEFLQAEDMGEQKEMKNFFILHADMSCLLLSRISPRFSSFLDSPLGSSN